MAENKTQESLTQESLIQIKKELSDEEARKVEGGISRGVAWMREYKDSGKIPEVEIGDHTRPGEDDPMIEDEL